MITVHELIDRLALENEFDLLESLQITPTELLHAFFDRVEEKQDELCNEYGYNEDESYES